MRHHHRCLSAEKLLQILHDDPLVVGIQGIRGFVKEDELRILIHRPGYQDALLLPLAQAVSLLPYLRVVAQGQALHKAVYVGHLCRPAQACLVDALHTRGDVARYAVREDKAVLHHHPAPPSPRPHAACFQRRIAQQDAPSARRIEAQQQLDQRRLAAAAHAHDGRLLSALHAQADVLQGVPLSQQVILEVQVFHHQVPARRYLPQQFLVRRFLVLLAPHLAQAVHAQAGVLHVARKRNQFIHRTVQLPDDVLHGQHHAQRHVPLHHQSGYQRRNHHILRLVDEHRSRILILAQSQAFHVHPEQPGLYPLPLPTLLAFTAGQLDFLHSVHQLHHAALVGALLREALVVQLRAFLHEQPHIARIERAASHEDQEHPSVVEQQHQSEHHDVERREHHAQAATRQEVLYARMVVDALQDVARHLRVEVAHRQPHQLAQEVRYQRDVDARAQVQQYPPADELHRRTAEGQHQLGYQGQVDEAQVLVVDAEVHHALRQEG